MFYRYLFLFIFSFFSGLSSSNYAQTYTQQSFDSLNIKSKKINVYLIPIGAKVTRTEISRIGTPFQKAKIFIESAVLPELKLEKRLSWNNPFADHKQFTKEMKLARNTYFERFQIEPNSIYFFIIPEYLSDTIQGYTIPGKSIAFITEKGLQNQNTLNLNLGSCLGLKFETDSMNVMNSFDVPWKDLNWEQCVHLREKLTSFSIYDDFENVSAYNGLVPKFIWEVNEDGEIKFDSNDPFSSLKQGELNNSYLVYRKISNPFFKGLFTISNNSICAIHLISVLISITVTLYFRRRFNRTIENSGFVKRVSLRFLKLILWGIFISIQVVTFLAVDYYYDNQYLKSIYLRDFKGIKLAELKQKLSNKNLFLSKPSKTQINQCFQKEGNNWKVTKERKVLYFELKIVNEKCTGRFVGSKNRLILNPDSKIQRKLNRKADYPYVVFSYFDENYKLKKNEVFNLEGKNIISKLTLNDPAKRILVFVNGYRPVSVSNSLEDNLKDIKKNGVEYPNSANILHNFDRHQYWTPWNEINNLFIDRINPSEIWYADGHHSVATSNFESVVNFSAISSVYPTTCKNLKKHTCFQTKIAGNKTVETYSLLATKSNKSGFMKRRKSGRVAGTNLKMLLNELPNCSENDTLFIVSHSMGYAYALGMIQELRGKINFGGFYIMAPENAGVGKTFINEWKEVWQYGANFEPKRRNAPCLQDGVAVQVKAKGLKEDNRVFFPFEKERQMGFFKSHFVGYYTWIFDIPKGKKGSVTKH
ncbi:MAG: hypothetical protein FJZ67_01625 [Bacteroidetes bacterium]|nr:hypothetical protein [Bacteroidota bacterium]